MTEQRYNLERIATPLIVQKATASAGNPVTWGSWTTLLSCKINTIDFNMGKDSSRAVISFPALSWEQSPINKCDKVRIIAGTTVLFCGYATKLSRGFASRGNATTQHLTVEVQDVRWLMTVGDVVYGQYARLSSAYQNNMQTIPLTTTSASPTPVAWLKGRRCIFNDNGRPNQDNSDAEIFAHSGSYINQPVFTAIDSQAKYWSARDMLDYLFKTSYISYQYFPYLLNASFATLGLIHSDFDTELAAVNVDGANLLEAIDIICQQIGWSFRIDWDTTSGSENLAFFKRGSSTVHSETHAFYAASDSEPITDAIARGDMILIGMDMDEDISPVINEPIGLGGVQKYEATFELVPGWLDDDLVPDTETLYLSDMEIKIAENPNSYDYFKYYHPKGSEFKPEVGRKWVLNETGNYSASSTYNRGEIYDFSEAIYSTPVDDTYAPFARYLKGCLSYVNQPFNSAKTKGDTLPVKVELSFNGGNTWHIVDGLIDALSEEFGIVISQPNLADLYVSDNDIISDPASELDGVSLNYWTSLCKDRFADIPWGNWDTRCRVTCSVEMDQRLVSEPAANGGGSLFRQRACFDLSDRYPFQQRETISIYDADYPSDNLNLQTALDNHVTQIRKANQDKAISGRYTLDFLWWDNNGIMIRPGDLLAGITGRAFTFGVTSDGTTKYPEISKVTVLGDTQQMQIYTRDVRFASI